MIMKKYKSIINYLEKLFYTRFFRELIFLSRKVKIMKLQKMGVFVDRQKMKSRKNENANSIKESIYTRLKFTDIVNVFWDWENKHIKNGQVRGMGREKLGKEKSSGRGSEWGGKVKLSTVYIYIYIYLLLAPYRQLSTP